MKKKLAALLVSMMVGLGLMAVADSASAACWIRGGYWANGYWHPARKVCNYYRGNRYYYRSGWRGGYYRGYRYW